MMINEALPSGNRHEFILPAIRRASRDGRSQTREEVYFNKGRIIVGGKLATRGQAKRPTMSFTSSPTSARVRNSPRTVGPAQHILREVNHRDGDDQTRT